MSEENIKAAVGKFMRNVSYTAQREAEKAVRNAVTGNTLIPGESVAVTIRLEADQIGLAVTIHSRIEL